MGKFFFPSSTIYIQPWNSGHMLYVCRKLTVWIVICRRSCHLVNVSLHFTTRVLPVLYSSIQVQLVPFYWQYQPFRCIFCTFKMKFSISHSQSTFAWWMLDALKMKQDVVGKATPCFVSQKSYCTSTSSHIKKKKKKEIKKYIYRWFLSIRLFI